MTEEDRLIEKLRLIEALFARPGTQGERMAAEHARERIRTRLDQVERDEPPVEYRFTLSDQWSRRLMAALLRRYGLRPYRYRGQRHTTVMVMISERFVDETLWPEFEQLHRTLTEYFNQFTERVISEAVHADTTEAEERSDPDTGGRSLHSGQPN